MSRREVHIVYALCVLALVPEAYFIFTLLSQIIIANELAILPNASPIYCKTLTVK